MEVQTYVSVPPSSEENSKEYRFLGTAELKERPNAGDIIVIDGHFFKVNSVFIFRDEIKTIVEKFNGSVSGILES